MKFKDREKYIGGSDLPAIMGKSKFKKQIDVALEKAGIVENDFSGNIYTEIGNLLEPRVLQIVGGLEDSKEYELPELNLKGHIDGRGREGIYEIKCVSSDLKKTFEQYEYQMRSYMLMTGSEKITLYHLKRDNLNELEKTRKKLVKKYNLKFNTSFNDLEDEVVEDIKIELKKTISKLPDEEIKKNISNFQIEKDFDKEFYIIENVRNFLEVVDEMKCDVLFDDKNKSELAYYEKKLRRKL